MPPLYLTSAYSGQLVIFYRDEVGQENGAEDVGGDAADGVDDNDTQPAKHLLEAPHDHQLDHQREHHVQDPAQTTAQLTSSDVTAETFRRRLKTFLFNCLDNLPSVL